MNRYKTLKEAGDLKNKRVIIRIDCNVPLEGEVVVDDFRLEASMPTIRYLIEAGAKILILGHLGRDGKVSIRGVADYLSKHFPTKVAHTIEDIDNSFALGSIVILENIRRFNGETENDESFGKRLSSFGDIYVNEAFSVSHRPHASIVGIPNFIPGFAGFQFDKEVNELSRALDPEHPFLFIVGGAKFETKLPLVEKFLEIADHVFVGGALANDLFKASGFEVGNSAVSTEEIPQSILKNPKLIYPKDGVIWSKGGRITRDPPIAAVGERIADAGPATIKALLPIVEASKLIVWNGPLGIYEEGFVEQTEALARIVADSGATTIIGGGDTVASLHRLNIENKINFVSTAGGAMLEFLLHGTLPGIKALERSVRLVI